MTTYIALFRGINVGGHNVLPMKELTAVLEREGHGHVRTYIQSGNVVFATAGRRVSEPALSKRIAAAVRRARGFEPRVMVLTVDTFRKIVGANPFPQAGTNPKSIHVFFLSEAPSKANLDALEAARGKRERFLLKDSAFYMYAPDGFGVSKLAAQAERHLGVDATARNWQTVTSLLALVDAG